MWTNLCPRTSLAETILLGATCWVLGFISGACVATLIISARCRQVLWLLVREAVANVPAPLTKNRLVAYRQHQCVASASSSATVSGPSLHTTSPTEKACPCKREHLLGEEACEQSPKRSCSLRATGENTLYTGLEPGRFAVLVPGKGTKRSMCSVNV